MSKKKVSKGITSASAGEAKRKHVLVAILGTAPAVLTEAVWALVMKKDIIPSKIVVLTTAEGRDRFFKDIYDTGKWDALLADLAAAGKPVGNVRLGKASFVTFADEKENEANDLVSYEANMRAADTMLTTLQKYAVGDEYVIHGLIAGGRKTMTALFFSCMCLLAREDDNVYHVLVSRGYDNPTLSPLFCYPQKGKVHKGSIPVRSGNRWLGKKVALKSELADVNLFSVPFVRMGRWAEQMCLDIKRGLTYENLITAVERSFEFALAPSVSVELLKGRLTVADCDVDLTKPEFVFFLCKMQRKTDDEATKMLEDLQIFMDDVGEDIVAASSIKWLRKFKDSGYFAHLDQGDQEKRKARIKNDCAHLKNRIKAKFKKSSLQEPLWRQIFGDRGTQLWHVERERITLEHLDEVPPEIRERLLPDYS